MDREGEGTTDECEVNPTIRVAAQQKIVFSFTSSSAATGCIDSICSGKRYNWFTSSSKINVYISSEQTHK